MNDRRVAILCKCNSIIVGATISRLFYIFKRQEQAPALQNYGDKMQLPKQKPNRLVNYDYSLNGSYFITICTQNRAQILSEIIVGRGLAPAECKLSEYGKIAEIQLLNLEKKYDGLRIDKYVIMPNHIHAIISINNVTAGASPRPTLSDMVCTFKSMTTRLCNKKRQGNRFFQTSFYDHVIRGEEDYREIWDYIDGNPAKWREDRFYTNR